MSTSECIDIRIYAARVGEVIVARAVRRILKAVTEAAVYGALNVPIEETISECPHLRAELVKRLTKNHGFTSAEFIACGDHTGYIGMDICLKWEVNPSDDEPLEMSGATPTKEPDDMFSKVSDSDNFG